MRNDFESNYLAHHGILGMKWGHKNGPPYPLDASDHSSSEKKAGYKKSILGKRNTNMYDRKITRLERAASAAKRDADDLRKAGYKKEAEAVQKISDKNRAKAEATRQLKKDNKGQMTKTQKTVVGVAEIAAAKSIADTIGNYRMTNTLIEGYGKIPLRTLATSSVIQAGKVAAVAALATYGTIKVAEYAKRKNDELKKNATNSSKTQKVENKVKEIGKDYFNDMRIKAVAVKDPATGDHIGVLESVLKSKGKTAAIKDARDPKSNERARSIETSYLDKMYETYLSNGMDKEQAYKNAISSFSEYTGYTKKTAENMYKKYSKYK